MSGGYIKPQKEGEHQIVTFTFVGPIDSDQVKKWNESLAKLKKMFGLYLAGVTVKGDPTPVEFMPKKKKKKK
jgi:2'-5' RNA ligase